MTATTATTAAAAPESPAIAERRARAAFLTVVASSDREYHVSRHGGRTHVVLVDLQGFLCDCEDFRYAGLGACKHTIAVLDFQRRQVTPLAAAADVLDAGGTDLAALEAEVVALTAARGRIDPVTWQAWFEELQRWLHDVMDCCDGEIRAELARIQARLPVATAAATPTTPPPAPTLMQKYWAARARILAERRAS